MIIVNIAFASLVKYRYIPLPEKTKKRYHNYNTLFFFLITLYSCGSDSTSISSSYLLRPYVYNTCRLGQRSNPTWMTMSRLSSISNCVVADELAMQWSWASAVIVSIWFYRNIPGSTRDGTMGCANRFHVNPNFYECMTYFGWRIVPS